MDIQQTLRKRLLEGMTENGATGVLVKCTKTDRFLLLKRNTAPYQDHWSLIAGGIEDGEESLEALKREVMEETGIKSGVIDYKYIAKTVSGSGTKPFYYYEGTVDAEITPKLNDEHTEFVWCDKDDLPTPLFPKTAEKIKDFS